jgi:hypothetical protein
MIAEQKLNIKIIPIPDLIKLVSVDTLITSKWNTVFTDSFFYLERENRFRFSLAHEIGHFVLHKEIYESLVIENIEDYENFFANMSQDDYRFFESQANRFANYLLIPTDRLEKEIEDTTKNNEKYKIFEEEEAKINYLSWSLCNKFKISEKPMTIAIKNLIKNNNIEI